MREQISKLNYRQITLLAGLIGVTPKTISRYSEAKLKSSCATISAIENGWKIYKKQIMKVK